MLKFTSRGDSISTPGFVASTVDEAFFPPTFISVPLVSSVGVRAFDARSVRGDRFISNLEEKLVKSACLGRVISPSEAGVWRVDEKNRRVGGGGWW